MPYTTNNPQGGLRSAHWIECHLCGGTTPRQPTEPQAWESARLLGWHRSPSFPLRPECPTCHAGLLGAA